MVNFVNNKALETEISQKLFTLASGILQTFVRGTQKFYFNNIPEMFKKN